MVARLHRLTSLLLGGVASSAIAVPFGSAANAQAQPATETSPQTQGQAAGTTTQTITDVNSQPNPSPTAQPADQTTIIVTAQKRSERLQDVPISISNVTAAQLSRSNIVQVAQLPALVPALRIDYSGDNIQPTIRGVGSSVAGPGFVSAIPLYVDGYYIPMPAATDINLINIASVQVLKGPQGTLFGYNATGGAILISTRQPQHTPTLLVRAGYGTHNHWTAGVYGSTGLSSTLAVDLAATYEASHSFRKNIITHSDEGQFDRWSFRPKILWTPSENVRFTLAYTHTWDSDPTSQQTNARDKQTVADVFLPADQIPEKRGDLANNRPDYNHLKTDSLTLTSAFDLGFANLTSYTGYRKDNVWQGLDYDVTQIDFYAARWNVPDKTFSQEFNLASKKTGRFNWVLGAFYLNFTDTYRYKTAGLASPVAFLGPDYQLLFTSKNKIKSYAVFADATYEAVDNLFLTLGGRYSINENHLNFDLIPAIHASTGSGSKTFKDFSGRAVVRYQLEPNSNVYASFTQGFKAGTLPGSAFAIEPVKPESINAWEVGYKTAGRVVRASVAGYYYNYKDIQVTTFGANGASITRNAASAHIYGLDGDLQVQVTPDLTLNLSAAYTHANYKDFPNAIATFQDLDPTSPTFPIFVNVNVDASGNAVLRAPRFSGSAGLNYRFGLAGGRMNLGGNLYYTSKFFFDAAHQLPQKGYPLLNLSATWTDPSDRFDVGLYGTNLTNAKYRTQNFIDTFANRQTWGDPIEVGAQLTYRY